MILLRFPASCEDTAFCQLPEPDMVVDPRHIGWWADEDFVEKSLKFRVTVQGTTLKVTRVDQAKNWEPGWQNDSYFFRVYHRNESKYSFESAKYLHHGVMQEHAPYDTKELSIIEADIKDGIGRIRGYAFAYCESLCKVNMPNTVTRIDHNIFDNCTSLQLIKLPPNLQSIGMSAFEHFSSLQAIYLPPTLTHIGHNAFSDCASLRILNIPDSVQDIGDITGCVNLMTDRMKEALYPEKMQWLQNCYNHLHNLCWDPSVSPQAIQQ